MYAIIKTGGKQYKVQNGDVLAIERVSVAEGEKITFDSVLSVCDKDSLRIGTPLLENVSVEAEVLEHKRSKKVIIFKKKRRKNYRRKNGHRQNITVVRFVSIDGNTDVITKKSKTADVTVQNDTVKENVESVEKAE